MDLNLSPEEIKFRDELRSWLAANAPKDWDERREESMESRFEYLKRWQRKLYEGGWAGISWPKEYGGRGASLMEQVVFWQEMALAQAPPLANVLGLGIIGPTIIAFGTEAQKKRHLQQPRGMEPSESTTQSYRMIVLAAGTWRRTNNVTACPATDSFAIFGAVGIIEDIVYSIAPDQGALRFATCRARS